MLSSLPLFWSCNWRQLFLFDVGRPVINLAWKIAHGVLYTADRLAFFGYSLQLSCFCNSAPESIDLPLPNFCEGETTFVFPVEITNIRLPIFSRRYYLNIEPVSSTLYNCLQKR